MNESQHPFPAEHLVLSENSIDYLKTTGKWAKFLAILNFIGLGLLLLAAIGMIIGGLFIGDKTGQEFPLILLGLFYLLLLGVAIIPTWYLFKFARNIEKMVSFRNNFQTEEAFRYLMYYYRFMGILTIIIMGLYLVAIIIGLVVGLGSMAFFLNK